jgi:hypothetical protein
MRLLPFAPQRSAVLPLIICLAGLAGCDSRASSTSKVQSLPTISLALGNRSITLEVANDDKKREAGLMHRDSMPACSRMSGSVDSGCGTHAFRWTSFSSTRAGTS